MADDDVGPDLKGRQAESTDDSLCHLFEKATGGVAGSMGGGGAATYARRDAERLESSIDVRITRYQARLGFASAILC